MGLVEIDGLTDTQKLEFLKTRELSGESTSFCVHLLYDFVINRNYKTIVELGIRSGVSTKTFLLGCKITGGHVWSVDISEVRVPNIHFGPDWGLEPFWTYTQHVDSLDYEWDKPIDLLFIDTSHTYEQTLAELRKYSPYIKDGGIILMHDSLMDHIKGWGVLRAIKTFLSDNHNYSYYETGVEGGLGVLTKLPHPFTWLFGE